MNRNPWVQELLTWHGHEKAGVKVPFDSTKGNPLGSRIETGVLQRLVTAAHALACGEAGAPRWIFLVGGPGNGKSEAVEQFVTALDAELALCGALVESARAKFSGQQLLNRLVQISVGDLGATHGAFASRIGKLVIIQDASASDEPGGRAAELLLREIFELMTTPGEPAPVFICCSNRGLLSSTLQEVRGTTGYSSVVSIITGIVAATALSRDMSLATRPTCWPLEVDPRFACWPMDLESLLVPASPTAESTFSKILAGATAEAKWELASSCDGCACREICPFLTNRNFLSTPDGANALAGILRKGELATGRRWNFRESFSLVAELVVGCRNDFPGHPCDWVHERAEEAEPESGRPAQEARSLSELAQRLFQNALYPRIRRQQVAEASERASRGGTASSEGLFSVMATPDSGSHHVREVLRTTYSPGLDPAIETPDIDTAQLADIENHFNHSVKNGLDRAERQLFPLEVRLLRCFASAEEEWEELARDSRANLAIRRLLRQEACAQAKRAIASRIGIIACNRWVEDYAATVRDIVRLRRLGLTLGGLFGDGNFRVSLVESFGQPAKHNGLQLQDRLPQVRPVPAPVPEQSRPAHDLPFLELIDVGIPLPVTFDLFLAITLRQRGCANSCLPASTRAAIDRARQLFAGRRCRDIDALANNSVRVFVYDAGELQADEDNQPRFEAATHGNR